MITQIIGKQRALLLAATFFFSGSALAQRNDFYVKSIKAYQKNYVENHEVVLDKKDKKYFHFFPVSNAYNVPAYFERIFDTTGFTMNTSAGTQKYFYKYGRVDFLIDGKESLLYVYQGKDLMATEQYKDYLFVPFTDATTGNESYGSGRYLEFYKKDIEGDSLQMDFNKAYNPNCAYSTGYKCPVPPRENMLPIAIKAGEMNFGKSH